MTFSGRQRDATRNVGPRTSLPRDAGRSRATAGYAAIRQPPYYWRSPAGMPEPEPAEKEEDRCGNQTLAELNARFGQPAAALVSFRRTVVREGHDASARSVLELVPLNSVKRAPGADPYDQTSGQHHHAQKAEQRRKHVVEMHTFPHLFRRVRDKQLARAGGPGCCTSDVQPCGECYYHRI